MYNELIAKIKDYMELSGKTQKQIAKECDISNAVLSQFFSGSYKGNNEKVADTLQKYLEQVENNRIHVERVAFNPELQNTQNIFLACDIARNTQSIVVICGDAGAGKTTALNYYKESTVGTILLTCSVCITSIYLLLKQIVEACGGDVGFARNKYDLFHWLVQKLTDSNRLLIIDEADCLNFEELQILRELSDQAGIGIVLSGNSVIYERMIEGKKSRLYAQLRSRVQSVQRIRNNTYNSDEFRIIFPMIPEECREYLLNFAKKKSLRSAVKLLNLTYEVLPDSKITVTTLKAVENKYYEGI